MTQEIGKSESESCSAELIVEAAGRQCSSWQHCEWATAHVISCPRMRRRLSFSLSAAFSPSHSHRSPSVYSLAPCCCWPAGCQLSLLDCCQWFVCSEFRSVAILLTHVASASHSRPLSSSSPVLSNRASVVSLIRFFGFCPGLRKTNHVVRSGAQKIHHLRVFMSTPFYKFLIIICLLSN